MNALTPNERREMSFRLKHSPALRGGTHWFNRVTLVQKIVQVNFNNSEYGYFKLTGVLGNGQRPCWVHELTSLSIHELRVFAEQKLGSDFVQRRPWWWRHGCGSKIGIRAKCLTAYILVRC